MIPNQLKSENNQVDTVLSNRAISHQSQSKEGYYTLAKETSPPKDLMMANLHVPTVDTPNFIKKITPLDVKRHIDINKRERSSRQTKKPKQKRNTRVKLTIDQMDLTAIYSVPSTHSGIHINFSMELSQSTFSKVGYMLAHKATLNKYKKISMITCILPDYIAI